MLVPGSVMQFLFFRRDAEAANPVRGLCPGHSPHRAQLAAPLASNQFRKHAQRNSLRNANWSPVEKKMAKQSHVHDFTRSYFPLRGQGDSSTVFYCLLIVFCVGPCQGPQVVDPYELFYFVFPFLFSGASKTHQNSPVNARREVE